jgi:hypothetical protein
VNRIAHFCGLILIVTALVVPVIGGPLWGYPVALLLGVIATGFVEAYPSDTSLRWTLAGFGAFLIFLGVFHLTQQGIYVYSLRESAFTLFFGAGCVWSAAFPVSRMSEPRR